MIIGIGIDLIEINRVILACQKEQFKQKVFTIEELKLINADIKKSADNFAVKEAVVKMLGTGFRKIKPIDIEVLRDDFGKPYVNLYNNALKIADDQNINRIHVSITNTKDYANAFVIGEYIANNKI